MHIFLQTIKIAFVFLLHPGSVDRESSAQAPAHSSPDVRFGCKCILLHVENCNGTPGEGVITGQGTVSQEGITS